MHNLLKLLLICGSALCVYGDYSKSKRFQYKYSFKAPYLAQKNSQVPFWSYSGNAIASSESMRITPSLRSQKGQAWSKYSTDFDWWEVELVFRINGRGRIGADGLALWYTVAPGLEGPVYGSSDKWNGLGLFFDTFDNDNKKNNPYIGLMVNDGTLAYDHENDGGSQLLGGCLRDFRNKPHPVRAKLEYYQNVLTLLIHNGLTNSDKDFETCARVENVHLPPRGYFGLSAATGGLADDHDVLKFLVSSLGGQDSTSQKTEEDERFQREFKEYQEKTKKAKEEYHAANPDAKKEEDEDDDFEGSEVRELRQIFQGQSQILDVIRRLYQKMDEIIGKQERTLSLVSGIQSGGGGAAAASGGSGGASTMARFEVDQLLNTQREIAAAARDVKSVVTDINHKSSQILNKPTGSAQPVGGAYDVQQALREMADSLNQVKHGLGGGRGAAQTQCPTCVGSGLLIGAVLFQLAVLLGYMVFRDSRDAQAKKFY